MGVNVIDSINDGRGPYVFKISGQLCHRIGALLPKEGKRPEYAQLYIFDTQNEIKNRMQVATYANSTLQPDEQIVADLIEMLNVHNPIVQLFRTARDRLSEGCLTYLTSMVIYSVLLWHQRLLVWWSVALAQVMQDVIWWWKTKLANFRRFKKSIASLWRCSIQFYFPMEKMVTMRIFGIKHVLGPRLLNGSMSLYQSILLTDSMIGRVISIPQCVVREGHRLM